ncbi:hypothetical protein [Phenylobacterium sp.]|jgi:hypothetical protein|uniref:hypothetical protein n=1 Tax=Phenylobacterium sp. TaxID=1871053 RepID=UPI002F429372
MNRVAKLVCWLAIVEMIAVGIAAVAARWTDIIHHPQVISLFGWRIVFALAFFPVWAAYGLTRVERRLNPQGMVLSMAHRRMTEVGYAVICPLMAGMDTWFAAIFAKHQMLLNASPQPVGLLVGGALLVVFGNASAKFAPPTGPAAPDPGAWIRASLRNGWATVLSGLAIMAAAFAPSVPRAIVVLTVLPVAVFFALEQRRLLRGGPGPRATA